MVRNDAKRGIFINLVKLNSEESKELFRKWLREGKIEDNLTLQGILEKGYEGWNSIKLSCYNYYNLQHLSLDELVNSWNELTINTKTELDKMVKQNQEYEEEIKALEAEQKELEARVEELEDEVLMEQEEAEKALNVAMKWRKNQMAEVVLKHDAAMGKLLDRIDLLENNLLVKSQEINWRDYLATKELPALPKQQKGNRLRKLKKLVSKVKEKTKEKLQIFIIQKSK